MRTVPSARLANMQRRVSRSVLFVLLATTPTKSGLPAARLAQLGSLLGKGNQNARRVRQSTILSKMLPNARPARLGSMAMHQGKAHARIVRKESMPTMKVRVPARIARTDDLQQTRALSIARSASLVLSPVWERMPARTALLASNPPEALQHAPSARLESTLHKLQLPATSVPRVSFPLEVVRLARTALSESTHPRKGDQVAGCVRLVNMLEQASHFVASVVRANHLARVLRLVPTVRLANSPTKAGQCAQNVSLGSIQQLAKKNAFSARLVSFLGKTTQHAQTARQGNSQAI